MEIVTHMVNNPPNHPAMDTLKKARVLFSEEQLAVRVAEMGADITRFYADKPLTVIALVNGAVPFAADLVRKIALPIYMDSLAVASYHADKRGEQLDFRSSPKLAATQRHILLVDEVLDSGNTLLHASRYFLEHGALSVRTAVIVEKDLPSRPGLPHADWTGFMAPDLYLVGYGLDSHELYRNLPYIGVLDA